MDEDSKELVKLAAEGGVDAFLKTVAAPIVEVGGWGADLIRRYRFKSTIKTFVLAQRWLDDAGLTAQPISLRVLVPLLEYASLADDVDESDEPEEAQAMQDRWAALLANAAAGDAGAEVLPSFPSILSELTPLGARILDALAASDFGGMPIWSSTMRLEIADSDTAARKAFAVHLDNLERQNLCSVYHPDPGLNALAKQLQQDHQKAWNAGDYSSRRVSPPSTDPSVSISALGRAFIQSCIPPTAA
jgi:hypothetical protein